MTGQSYAQLVGYKEWADLGLYEVVGRSLERLPAQDAALLLRILDHIQVVDRIFQAHLEGTAHGFHAPRSEGAPDFPALLDGAREVDRWYCSYAGNLSAQELAQPLDLVFTSGKAARLRRSEIILHVCLHGTYHRGNAGVLLQKNGIAPNDDRMTDFLEAVE